MGDDDLKNEDLQENDAWNDCDDDMQEDFERFQDDPGEDY